MVATAAHLTDHVLPDLQVRQGVPAVPKRLHYFLERDADIPGTALHLFLRAVESCLGAHSPVSDPARGSGVEHTVEQLFDDAGTAGPQRHPDCKAFPGNTR